MKQMIKTGLKFRAAPDSQTPKMEFWIIETGLRDCGFPAVRLRYADGEEEICAVEILLDGIDNRGLIVLGEK